MSNILLLLGIALCLVLLAWRLADQTEDEQPNHLLVIGTCILAAGLAIRGLDVLNNLHYPRLSAAIGAWALVAFLASDPMAMARLRRFFRRVLNHPKDGDA